jgi:5,10-methylenetetrahydrofolate reductase
MNLKEKIKSGKFVVTTEISSPKGTKMDEHHMDLLSVKGIADAVNICDCPMANMRMSSIIASFMVFRDYGLETICHITCRDRNLIGLQSELLGASALGVNNILAVTGDPPEAGDTPEAAAVFDVDSIGLITIMEALNKGHDKKGNRLNGITDFFIGSTANPTADDFFKEVKRLKEKVKAGAHFVQTQPIFEGKAAQPLIDVGKELDIPIIIGILPLKSYKMAIRLKDKIPGIYIPDSLIERMKDGGREEGIKIAREIIKDLPKGTAGVHIMPLDSLEIVRTLLS